MMEVFNTYLYEVLKGTKPAALITCGDMPCSKMVERLKRYKKEGLDFEVKKLSCGKVNLFFGKAPCIEVIRGALSKPLNSLSPHEDFMLGIILGYDTVLECKRFLQKLKHAC